MKHSKWGLTLDHKSNNQMMKMARKGLTTIAIIKAATVGGEREHTIATTSYCLDDQQSTHHGDREDTTQARGARE